MACILTFVRQSLYKSRGGCRIYRMSGCRAAGTLPPKPRPPEEADCCDSSCTLCVKDIYEQELNIWKQECNNILLKAAPKSQLSPDAYMKCQLIDISSLTHNTSIYTFDSKGYVEIKAGQHLILRELVGGTSITRQYTPIAVPQPDEFTFKILIKHYRNGSLTSHVLKNWKIGDEIEWRGPHGLFSHQPNKYMKYLMLAAGTGIAPMLNIARLIVGDDDDITTIKLLYGCRTYEEILLKSELKELSQHWNFTYKCYLSQDADVERKKGYGENAVNGRLGLAEIAHELTKIQSTRVLLCGTRQFDTTIMEYCRDLRVPAENFHKF